MTAIFDAGRQIADAVLYEGYVLYPYRASAQKNQIRWQFGVLTPREWSEDGGSEPWSQQTETLLEADDDAVVRLKLRCLQAQSRTVEEARDGRGEDFRTVTSLEVDGADLVAWDEGVEQEIDAAFDLATLLAKEQEVPFILPAGRDVETIENGAGRAIGRVVRERWPLRGVLLVAAERFEGPYGIAKLRVRVQNVTPWCDDTASRDDIVRRSLIAAHTLIALESGTFVSLLEPPEWARPAAATCENLQTWPVLVGEGRRDLVLSSPIILYDYPSIAPESQGDLFDALEIDEILTLRTMALTDAEKREARATDQRAAAIIDRVDTMPQEMLDKLHGAIRYLREVPGAATAPPEPEPARVPWWDPGADASVSPESDSVLIGDVSVARGSHVRLQPGTRRADAQDMFFTGRLAHVEAVFLDVDGNTHLAVTLTDDPAADLHQWHGRFLYFAPDEVIPVGVTP